MPVDYDAPRTASTDEIGEQPLDELTVIRRGGADAAADVDEDAEDLDVVVLPDADLSGEELSVRVIPKQADEFTCSSCFLVQHQHRLAKQVGDRMICADCV